MSRNARRFLLRNALSALVTLDLLALTAFVLNQWFALDIMEAWRVAAAFALPVFVLVQPLSGAVLAMADRYAGIPDTGEKIPRAGQ